MDLGFFKNCLDLKVKLDKFVESFSKDKTSKICSFSAKIKILLMIKQGKTTPKELIENLAIAKSNITIICDGMIGEKLISKAKSETNKKNIYYKITQKGENELNKFIEKLSDCYPNINELPNIYDIEYKINDISQFLEVAMGDDNAKNI